MYNVHLQCKHENLQCIILNNEANASEFPQPVRGDFKT